MTGSAGARWPAVWALAMLLVGCTPVQPLNRPPARPALPIRACRIRAPTPQPGHTSRRDPTAVAVLRQPAPHPAPGQQGNGGIQHIVVIVLENKAASQIMGASEAGYFNKLAAEYSRPPTTRRSCTRACRTISP